MGLVIVPRFDFGDDNGLPLPLREIGDLVEFRKANPSNEGGRDPLEGLAGGRGAGLGLKKRSGSSGTFSKPGLKGGVTVWMAVSSGVVTAYATKSDSSAMGGNWSFAVGGLNGANLSHIPEFLGDNERESTEGAKTACGSSGKSSMGDNARRDDERGGAAADWV